MRYFTLLLLLIAGSATAQTMQGIVFDAGTRRPIWPVTVVNIRTQEAVLTSENGFYSIHAEQGDKIAFSYVGYKAELRPKPPSVIVATQDVFLTRTETQLQEVKVRLRQYTKFQLDSIERRSIYKLQLQRRPPSAFASPVSAIAEKFSKKAKRTYAFQKEFARMEDEKWIDSRYTPELVTELTGITGDTIGHFMYAYPMAYDFARAASDLEIKLWIRENYRAWIKKDTINKRH